MALEDKARQLAQRKQQEEAIDWNAERDWWLDQLERLYDEIEAWLAPLVTEGVLQLQRQMLDLSEEHLGSYQAPLLVLDFSGAAVILEPRGTLIVGSRGRVDVFRRGYRGKQSVMLILGPAKDEPSWSIWPSKNPRDRQPLDDSTFKALIESFL